MVATSYPVMIDNMFITILQILKKIMTSKDCQVQGKI